MATAPDAPDTSYGAQDPTALFQQLTGAQGNPGAQGLINRNMANLGMNPALQHARMVQGAMQRILGGVQPEEGEDPLDTEMRRASAVSSGMLNVDPRIAMNADQQIIKLKEAKTQQGYLQAETARQRAEATASSLAQATDPMVFVKPGKDQYGLPTYTNVGTPVSVTDEKGNIRDGWSADVSQGMQANPGTTPMRLSQYNQLIEKMNEPRALAMMARVNQQFQIQMLARMSPDAVAMRAQQLVDREADPGILRSMQTSRNPVVAANANDIVDYAKNVLHVDPSSIDESDFKNNTKTYAAFNAGPQGDMTRRFNVALTHGNLLRQYAQNMRPDGTLAPDTPFFNYFRTTWQKWGGGDAPTTFDAVKDFVADEWGSAIISSRNGAALADRAQAQDHLTRSASQAQINSALDGWMTLGGGQLTGLEREFKSGIQGVPSEKVDARWNQKLAPEAQAEYGKTKGGTAPMVTLTSSDKARLDAAREAIKQGAPADAVKARLGAKLAGQL